MLVKIRDSYFQLSRCAFGKERRKRGGGAGIRDSDFQNSAPWVAEVKIVLPYLYLRSFSQEHFYPLYVSYVIYDN